MTRRTASMIALLCAVVIASVPQQCAAQAVWVRDKGTLYNGKGEPEALAGLSDSQFNRDCEDGASNVVTWTPPLETINDGTQLTIKLNTTTRRACAVRAQCFAEIGGSIQKCDVDSSEENMSQATLEFPFSPTAGSPKIHIAVFSAGGLYGTVTWVYKKQE